MRFPKVTRLHLTIGLLLAALAGTVSAQAPTEPGDVVSQMTWDQGGGIDVMKDLAWPIVLSVVFTLVGVVLFAASIWIIVKVSPFSVQKEIEEDQNMALGIIIGAIIIGIAIILAASIIG